MKRILSILFVFLCLISAAAEARSNVPRKTISHVIYVPTDFYTIQSAVNAANPGDTVFVYNGTYFENVVVNKSVSLIGQNKSNTIIDGNKTSSSVVYITADKIQVSGFTIQNSGMDKSGIYLDHSRNSTLTGNHVVDNDLCGIFLFYSEGCTVSNNVANDNENGIVIDASSNCYISGNNVTNNYFGLSLLDSGPDVLRHNSMSGNQYNFKVTGVTVTDFIHDIDFSNTVDGKPICYLVNQRDMHVPVNAGFMGVINSTNITVENLTITRNMWGVLLAYTRDSTVKNVMVSDNYHGIRLQWSEGCIVTGSNANNNTDFSIVAAYSTNCTISRNNASNNEGGVYLWDSQGCTISENNASNNSNFGIWLEHASGCVISGNYINNNYDGISLRSSNNNSIFHNSFIKNTREAYCSNSLNLWDNGYEGNFWSQYNHSDENEDGIGDTAYVIDENNQDTHPLMGMFSNFNITWQEGIYYVTMISNSTTPIFDFEIVYDSESQKVISFNVTGPSGSVGFCRVVVPRALIDGPYTVLIDGGKVSVKELPISNSTHAFLYFKYSHGAHHVIITQEFPPTPILPIFIMIVLFIIIAIIAIFLRKRL
jgi:parallel beta-helix repeat protein